MDASGALAGVYFCYTCGIEHTIADIKDAACEVMHDQLCAPPVLLVGTVHNARWQYS